MGHPVYVLEKRKVQHLGLVDWFEWLMHSLCILDYPSVLLLSAVRLSEGKYNDTRIFIHR